MDNRGLLFIPDISGFTRFINETEIDHSRLIMQEILELLINTNDSGLEVSEIEGDAILFYRFGEAPPLEEIYGQVEKMFCAFHSHLKAYEYRRFCQCKACVFATNLSLKIVTHYGVFTGYNVRNFQKLLGRDVIVAHQLLKNDIEQHEYWLVTDSLLNDAPPQLKNWMEWMQSEKQTETGAIPFQYTQLSPLRQAIKPELPPMLQLNRKRKVVTVQRHFAMDIIPMFHLTGDFSWRSRWQPGVTRIEELSHYLPRIGMRYRSIGDDGGNTTYASSYSFDPDRIEFSETEEECDHTSYYTLIKEGENRTQLQIDYFIPRGLFTGLRFMMKEKKKKEAYFATALHNIELLVQELKKNPAPFQLK